MEIPKAYEPKEVEGRWYPFWEQSGFFSPENNSDPKAKTFSMVIPPPNVTGYLHMGHALNHTLQDVLARWRRMAGDRVLWLPGTDHAGIATQMVVERQLAAEGVKRQDLGREKFVERVWQWKEHSGGTIQRQMRIVGDSVDWSRERFTMDDGLSNAVKEVFVRLYDEGLIYRGEYMINWSPGLQTAISDLEVEMKPVKGKLYHIAYPIGAAATAPVEGLAETYETSNADEKKSGYLKTAAGEFIVVATTRPETMLGDTAIAMNPEDAGEEGRYAAVVGKTLVLPLVGREISFIQDEVVEKDFGTGFVKVTPAHDPNDFAMGKRHSLEFIQVIGKDAKMTDAVPEKYRGLDRYEARKAVVADLESLGLLLKVEDYTHNVGHCQRSGTVVEPLISMQWFMRMKELAEPAIAAVRDGRTKFVPESTAKIYFNWLENIQDWCVSRQLWWGHRIPAWHTPTGEIVVARDEAEARERLKARGLDSTAALTEEQDVLDTWFSSQLWPFSTLGWPEETEDLKKFYPTEVLVTAFDIIFFWVARMMMMGLKFMGEVPFRTVYINALVLDPQGQKMSKTKGNVIDPLDVFAKYGTDAARFALTAASTAGMTLALQESKLETARNFANKIWNATRFVLMNCDEVLEAREPVDWETELSEPELADLWIQSRLSRVALDVHSALGEYRFHEAAAVLYQFFWNDFCDWYIELSKPFVTAKEASSIPGPQSLAVKRRIIYVLERSLRLLHPIMPYITEELWQRLPHRGETISTADFVAHNSAQLDGRAEREMALVIDVITKLRNIRSSFNIAPSVPLTAEIAATDDASRSVLETMESHIKRLARIESLYLVDRLGTARGSARAVVTGAEIAVPLEGLVDFDKERARLEKEIGKLTNELATLEKRLGNADFIARAAADVVETSRQRAVELTDQIAKLKATIESL
ncbi:MAG TPA: valine--tRNA ligase [Blastocatellia bacterium]|nr:valine--tRNA ligase [Blastocatellia bacterium]HMV81953.1 valine--tRNA ligase [Blastocatellia bacterium]HMX24170.1 valine--tRNA ligase [Blastocatellia bacterium]HMY71602.1 valine--tRNA ligase [Blastocatellia bacterium]HMZ16353.1 valine--tRNA ligase [Blastocatellia bacterium]